MKKIYLLICLFIAAFLSTFSFETNAACLPGQVVFKIVIVPDNFPAETSWDVKDSAGNVIASGTSQSDSICVNPGSCYRFTIYDSFGDGMCCNYGNGSYTLLLDGTVIRLGGSFTHNETTSFGCPSGFSCDLAIPVVIGNYVTSFSGDWYSFVPTVSGVYRISTCFNNAANTILYVYDHCEALVYDSTNIGTIYFNDDEGGCGLQAGLNALLDSGQTYFIRVAAHHELFFTNSINWTISYSGPVTGCTDPTACNYNPIAVVSDTCIYAPSPNCPQGPDLAIDEPMFLSSLQLSSQASSNCSVIERCLTGYGTRTVIKFSTHIMNIGNQDYYIGVPFVGNPQFDYNNCHGHPHYVGYAEYLLFRADGQNLPASFKNGFCVLDLECSSGGGTAHYGCSNMGISAGCGDVYSSGLSCQWIDITDVDTGMYTFVIRVNWDQSPDALGHYETNYDNNWAQVCIHINRDGSGNTSFTLDPNCAPYTDCAGVPYGSSQFDCNGICGGTTLRGDLDGNLHQEVTDAHDYVNGILDNSLTAASCTDLNNDGEITVYDAALMTNCALYGGQRCNFPSGIFNPNDTVALSIGTVNTIGHYVDINILNPDNFVKGYQFELSGLTITGVQTLIDTIRFPMTPMVGNDGSTIIGLCFKDSTIDKNMVPTPFCRVYYSNEADTICMTRIVDIVNKDYEQVATEIGDSCQYINLTGINSQDLTSYIHIYPNPSSGVFNVNFKYIVGDDVEISITNLVGQEVHREKFNDSSSSVYTLDLSSQPEGFYLASIKSNHGSLSKKLTIVR